MRSRPGTSLAPHSLRAGRRCSGPTISSPCPVPTWCSWTMATPVPCSPHNWYRRIGFPRVHVLAGGVPAWRASGRRVTRGRPSTVPLGLAAATSAAPFLDAGRSSPAASENRRRRAPWWSTWGRAAILRPVTCPERSGCRAARWSFWAAGLRPDRAVVLASADEGQSILAARALARVGREQIHVLEGGVGAWRAAGFLLAEGLPDGVNADDMGGAAIPARPSRNAFLSRMGDRATRSGANAGTRRMSGPAPVSLRAGGQAGGLRPRPRPCAAAGAAGQVA